MSVDVLPPSAPEYSHTENFTHYCLHRPMPFASKIYLMYRTNWSAKLITTAKWQKKL